MEDGGGAGAGAALQLGFDGPGEGGLAVAGEYRVGAFGVLVFGVEEEAVHVEEADADWGEAGGLLAWFCLVNWEDVGLEKMLTYLVLGGAMIAVVRDWLWGWGEVTDERGRQ